MSKHENLYDYEDIKKLKADEVKANDTARNQEDNLELVMLLVGSLLFSGSILSLMIFLYLVATS